MSTRKIRIKGNNHAVNSSATVTFDGVEVFSGAVSAEVIDESDVWSSDGVESLSAPVEMFEFEYNNADDTQETEHSLRIEVAAGQIRAGNIWVEATRDASNTNLKWFHGIEVAGVYYYNPGDNGVYGDGSESALPERTNILINDAEPISIGYDGNNSGQEFLLSAGDTFACTVRVPAILS
jgi:hypothetical protein|tara:strand:+ start:71 stop:610 length:540 start_codon:yes stop_codon:yes gene_type:complete